MNTEQVLHERICWATGELGMYALPQRQHVEPGTGVPVMAWHLLPRLSDEGGGTRRSRASGSSS